MKRFLGAALFTTFLSLSAALTAPLLRRGAVLHAQTTGHEATADHPASVDGAAVYNKACAGCHNQPATHAPPLSVMNQMSPEATLQVLVNGNMKPMAAGLSEAEKRAVTRFVTGKPFGAPGVPAAAEVNMCGARSTDFSDPSRQPGWMGWSPGLNNTRFQPNPGLSAADVPKLELRWAFGFPDAYIANGQPSVVNGHLFLGTTTPAVYSLNAKSGCTEWVFHPEAGVRTGITVAKPSPLSRYAAFFGDGRAFVYAVDAGTGTLIWKVNVEQFPAARITGTPVYHEGRLYVPIAITEEGSAINPHYECCRARPSMVALDAATGKLIWRHYMVDRVAEKTILSPNGTQQWGPSGVSVWSSPTLDPAKRALYVGTGNNFSDPPTETSDAIVALSMDTGDLLWTKQIFEKDAYNVSCVSVDQSNCPKQWGPDSDFGSSPMLMKLANGKRALIAGQKSGVVTALDPDANGAILWQARVGKGGLIGGIEWGTAADGNVVYAALSDMGWVGLNILDPGKGGGIFALRADNGQRIWYAPPVGCAGRAKCSPAQSAAVSAIPGAVFSGSEDGHMRAYSSQDGHILWDYNTVSSFDTINRVRAKGGSIDGPGPAIVDGIVYVPSGYPNWGGLAGNVLLAFSVKGK